MKGHEELSRKDRAEIRYLNKHGVSKTEIAARKECPISSILAVIHNIRALPDNIENDFEFIDDVFEASLNLPLRHSATPFQRKPNPFVISQYDSDDDDADVDVPPRIVSIITFSMI